MPTFSLLTKLKVSDDFSRAVTTAFEKAENFGDKVAKKVGKSLRKAFSLKRIAIGAGAVTAGAAAGAVTLGNALNGLAQGMAKVGRAAKEQQIDPQFLSALQRAAVAKGVEDPDEVLRSTEEFLLRLQDLRAKDPTGELFAGLKDIGRKDLVKEFKKAKTPIDAVTLALSTLSLEKDAAKRVKLADALFGGSDASLDLRRVAEDADALRDLFKNQKDLAGATKEQFDAAVRLDDAKKKLRARVRGLAVSMAGNLTPAFERAVNRLESWFWQNEELINQRLDKFVEWISGAIDRLMSSDWEAWLTRAVKFAQDLADVLVLVGKGVIAATKYVRELTVMGGAFFAAWAVAKLGRIYDGILNLAKGVGQTITALRTATGAARAAGNAMRAAFVATGAIGGALALVGVIKELNDQLEEARRITREKVEFDVAGGGSDAAGREVQIKRQLEFLRQAEAGLRSGFLHTEESREVARDFGMDQAAAQRAVAEQIARLSGELEQASAQRQTAETLGRISSQPARTEEEARQRRGLELLRQGQLGAPEAQELLQSLPDRAFALQLLERDKRIRELEEGTARLSSEGPGTQSTGTPVQTPPPVSGADLQRFLGDMRQLVQESTRQANRVSEALGAQQVRADLGARRIP